jgi:hypothetical protein
VCKNCGHVEHYPSGAFDVNLEGGSEYPDALGCGAYPFLIISERVVDDWNQAGIDNYLTYPVRISSIDSADITNKLPPNYWRIEMNGTCSIDLLSSGLVNADYCAICGNLRTGESQITGFIMEADSWDGSDLFRDKNQFPRINFCTMRILELAKKKTHSNFRFEPMQGPFGIDGKGITYL